MKNLKSYEEVKALVKEVLTEKGIAFEIKTYQKVDGCEEKLTVPVDGVPGLCSAINLPHIIRSVQKELEDVNDPTSAKETVWNVLADIFDQAERNLPKGFNGISPDVIRAHLDTSLGIRLVNAEEHDLEGFVYRTLGDLDLAMVCYIDISDVFNMDRKAAVTLRKETLKAWGVSEDEVFARALSKLENEEPALMYLKDVLFGGSDKSGTLIISNSKMHWGAAFIASDAQMAKVSEEYFSGKSFRIIPSSVHEVLALPLDLCSLDEVAQMVHDVNLTEVIPEERLSNCVYWYNADTKHVEMEYRADNGNLLSDAS